MSNLTKENAGKVFGKGETRKFFAKGGASILATHAVQAANAQKSYVVNKLLSMGGQDWSGELHQASADKSYAANKAMSKGQYLGSGGMSFVAPEKALEIVNAAEAQYAAIRSMSGKEM